jgi:L-ascorbate metabolism protein UlaG (beta-lactamase superfamily)
MKVTYFGHGCFSIGIGDSIYLIDPFITPNKLAKHIDIYSIKADYILLTHGHEDHVADTVEIYKNTNAQLIANFEINNWFAAKGVENGIGMNIGGAYQTNDCAIKMVSATHSSSMPDGSYGGLAAGFIFVFEEDEVDKVVYFAGDTGLHKDMELIEEEFGYVDFAFLPIGDVFTLGINDAVEAAYLVNADGVIPMHYNTFPSIEVDLEEAKIEFEEFRFEIFNIGEEKELI